CFRPVLLNERPRAADDEMRSHTRVRRWNDVVVDPVTDVRDLLRRAACLGRDPGEERGARLLDAPALGRRDEINLDVLREKRLDLNAEVPGDADHLAPLL